MKKQFVILLLATGSVCAAQDSAVVLARILASKGIISKEDLARVEAAPATTPARLALVSGTLASAVAPPAAATAPPPATPATQPRPAATQSQPAADKPVVTVYGSLLWNSYYNTSLTNNADIPFLAGKQGSDPLGNDKNFGMTARQTRLGVRFQGPMAAGAKTSGVVESDFFGGQSSLPNAVGFDIFRLRLAYARMDWKNVSLIAGQDWSVFAPLNPTSLASYAVPAIAGSGNPWIRTPQLRLELHNRSFLWQLAATDPNVGDYPAGFLTARTPLSGERGRLPGVDSRWSYLTKMNGKDANVSFSAHYGRGKNAGVVGTRNVQQGVDSWGVALDYTLPVASRLTFTGEIFDGRALGVYSASFGQSVLPVGTPGAHGVGTGGGWMQAQVQLAPRWQWNSSYGLESNEAANLRTGDRNRNQTVMSNVMFKLSPQLTVAGEWRRFLTNYYNQWTLNERGDHFNLAVGYIF